AEPKQPRHADLNPPYAGMTLCYNRSPLANCVHDLVGAIVLVHSMSRTNRVDLIGVGQTGPAALLAKAIAGDAITRAAIDLNHFDFDQVKADSDPMLLPGALKYGGIYGFAPLCAGGTTSIFDAPKSAPFDTAGVTISRDVRDADALGAEVLKQ